MWVSITNLSKLIANSSTLTQCIPARLVIPTVSWTITIATTHLRRLPSSRQLPPRHWSTTRTTTIIWCHRRTARRPCRRLQMRPSMHFLLELTADFISRITVRSFRPFRPTRIHRTRLAHRRRQFSSISTSSLRRHRQTRPITLTTTNRWMNSESPSTTNWRSSTISSWPK